MKNKFKEFLQVTIFPIVYYIGSLRKIENDILLLDAHNDACPESLELLRNELKANGIAYDERYHNFGQLNFLKSFIISLKTVYKVSTYKIIILCDNYLAIDSFNRRKESTIIQLWHGAGAYKKFGYDKHQLSISNEEKHKLFRYDLVPVSSRFSAQSFSSAMKLQTDNFPVIGVSRTDKFFDDNYLESTRTSIYKDYPELRDKKVILWAPTFRSLNKSNSHVGDDEIEQLINTLPNNYVIIKKLHPHIAPVTKYSKYNSSEFMTIADVLITDYSSLIFDWMFFEKNTQIFIPDYDEYIKTNGFYYDPMELPFPKSRNFEELIQNINAAFTPTPEFQDFKELMLSNCDGKSTERLVEIIQNILISGESI